MALTVVQKSFIDFLLSEGETFLICSLPGSEKYMIFGGKHLEVVAEEKGFEFHCYSEASIGTFAGEVLRFGESSPDDEPTMDTYPSTDKGFYLAMVDRIVQRLSVEGGKTVYSRVIAGNVSRPISEIVDNLFDEFPATFRFLFSTPSTGLWLGTSPELLAHNGCESGFETMALAGTRKVVADDRNWDDKNRDEHRMVVEFIGSALRENCLNPKCGSERNLRFGSIEHLCTPIVADFASDFNGVLGQLSPTPALCGYPREKARSEIHDCEQHKRGCYGGYVAFDVDGEQWAYVILRCAHLQKSKAGWNYNIFAGGGLTSKSESIKEWEETELKSASLKRALAESKNEKTR